MSMSDPIADLLTRIRNAQMAGLPTVSSPSSKIKVAICEVLKSEGYIAEHAVDANNGKPQLNITLKYYADRPVVEEIKRVSRPGLRLYKGKQDVPKIRAGLGISILTTNKGLMTDKQALAAGIGGEILCTVF